MRKSRTTTNGANKGEEPNILVPFPPSFPPFLSLPYLLTKRHGQVPQKPGGVIPIVMHEKHHAFHGLLAREGWAESLLIQSLAPPRDKEAVGMLHVQREGGDGAAFVREWVQTSIVAVGGGGLGKGGRGRGGR
jgi:hypothetical protein